MEIGRLSTDDAPLLIGSGSWHKNPRPHAEEMYDGKIENPSVFTSALDDQALNGLRRGTAPRELRGQTLLASWDFSVGISTDEITDTSPNHLHGKTVNMPMRAVTGHSWKATEQCFARALDEYAAIHFHSDDLSDAGWDPDFELQIPTELASGAYAVHLVAGSGADDIPFFVNPRPSSRASMAVLLPSFTYLAYGNTHPRTVPGIASAPRKPGPADLFLANHPEFGRSLYDNHADDSGCCYSSRLRPLVQIRPDHRSGGNPRHFAADLLFLEWLERKGFQYDVLTDEDLHAAGQDLISEYSLVVTGHHPEYSTGAMLDALQAYVDDGGKLMYLGGNGFYWVTSVDQNQPHIIEVRRGVAGTREWSSEPGELYHSTTGEFGGLWRHRGRAPNRLVGVGFCALSASDKASVRNLRRRPPGRRVCAGTQQL